MFRMSSVFTLRLRATGMPSFRFSHATQALHGAARRQIFRDRALLAARAQQIHQPVDHFADVAACRVTSLEA